MPSDAAMARNNATGMSRLPSGPNSRRSQQTFTILRGIEPDPAINQLQTTVGQPAYSLGVDRVFLGQNARRQACFVIVIEHRHGRLHDDRAMIECGRDKMNGATVHLDALIQRAPMRVQAGEGRQQRRMDVDQPASETRYEPVAQNPHETGQYDEIGRKSIDYLGQGGIEIFTTGNCR